MHRSIFALPATVTLSFTLPAQAELTAADYRRAESFLAANTTPLVTHTISHPSWLGDGRLAYRNSLPGGHEFIVADPADGTRMRLFDHGRFANALSKTLGQALTPLSLPLSDIRVTTTANTPYIDFRVARRRFRLNPDDYRIEPRPQATVPDSIVSPDGRHAAFIRNHNLFMWNLQTNTETPLTRDGTRHFGYATNNAGWVRSDRPVLLWSPDSRKIATFRHDGRDVGDMHLLSTDVGRPRLETWRYPLPGDPAIFRIHRVVIHIDGPRVIPLRMPPDAHRSTTTDHVAARDGRFLDVQWSPDSEHLAFVSSTRDHKRATLRVADPATGAVRDVYSQTEKTYYESGQRQANWHVLPNRKEFLWFSEKSDHGHLYLHDLATGRRIRSLAFSPGRVLQLLRVDARRREAYVLGSGREPGDPYFHYLYRLHLDSGKLTLLTPGVAHHEITLSPSGDHFLDVASTPTTPPVAVLRDRDGKSILALETADISRLVKHGWQPPIPFQTKARDGKTDLFGLLYRPTRLDESRSYPILNYLYPGPQSGSVGTRAFRPSRADKQSLAELGFVVVEVDAMGTPGRSKSFHDAYYGNMGDNGLPDQVTTIRQLAARHPYMDLSRVGIWGHSGGGFASTAGILRYPDFYKVAVSQAGNHDNRNYEDDWGEKWQGLLQRNADGSTNYDNQANQLLAKNLRGKLLLAHGTMDSNVPPSNTLLVVDALIAANKDFDLIMFPNRGHGFGSEPYMMRRRWDYFVRHLHHTTPPANYRIETDTRRRR